VRQTDQGQGSAQGIALPYTGSELASFDWNRSIERMLAQSSAQPQAHPPAKRGSKKNQTGPRAVSCSEALTFLASSNTIPQLYENPFDLGR